jgi:peptidoglycan/LPS O-acetylase OafA/YrhL
MKRNHWLDVLRGAAVLSVFCYHSTGVWFGWIGVDLFFVLSGFLVSGLLFREYQSSQQVRPGTFLLRRGLKIYPQFYVFIAAMLVVAHFQGNPPRFGQAAAELAFVQNYATGIWSHTWSLGVEEHFYILLTLVITLLARRGGANPFRLLPGWIAASCLVILGLRVLTWKLHPQISFYGNVCPSHLRIDSLLAGVLAAYYQTFRNEDLAAWMRRTGKWAPRASILLLSPVLFLDREHPFMVTIGFSLVSFGFVLLLLSVLHPVKRAGGPSRAARAMGRLAQVSYGFYLWHGAVLVYAPVHGASIPLAMVATLGASLLLALASTWLIEIPVLRWRDRCSSAEAKAPRQELAAHLVTQTP